MHAYNGVLGCVLSYIHMEVLSVMHVIETCTLIMWLGIWPLSSAGIMYLVSGIREERAPRIISSIDANDVGEQDGCCVVFHCQYHDILPDNCLQG